MEESARNAYFKPSDSGFCVCVCVCVCVCLTMEDYSKIYYVEALI